MTWMRRVLGVGLSVAVLIGIVLLLKPARSSSEPLVRAVWVTRFNYDTASDVEKIIRNVAEAGFTDVFFQVRGNGTAYYKSSVEPWAYELSGDDVSSLGVDPGWDPLQLAIDVASEYDLKVHAYLNVLPGWKGLGVPSKESGQLWSAKPDWFMIDSLGNTMLPTSGWYSFVNPVLPEVRSHLRSIVSELCDYDVAGIHLDYIRYPYDYRLVAAQRYPDATEAEILRHADFAYDPASFDALTAEYGTEVTSQMRTQFLCESVTKVVRDFSHIIDMKKPSGCVLSASVLGNPVSGRQHAFQDSGHWVREGLVGWVVQMNYGTSSFEPYLFAMRRATGRKGFRSSVVVGINGENGLADLKAQVKHVELSGCRGFALFSYSAFFDDAHQMNEKGRSFLPVVLPNFK